MPKRRLRRNHDLPSSPARSVYTRSVYTFKKRALGASAGLRVLDQFRAQVVWPGLITSSRPSATVRVTGVCAIATSIAIDQSCVDEVGLPSCASARACAVRRASKGTRKEGGRPGGCRSVIKAWAPSSCIANDRDVFFQCSALRDRIVSMRARDGNVVLQCCATET